MGQWIEFLTAYAAALGTIATVILWARLVGRRSRRAVAPSRPVLVVSDGGERHRPAA